MNSVNHLGLLAAEAALAAGPRPVKSISDLEADRVAQQRQILRHASLTKMLRSQGIRRSPTRRCACGKTISHTKTSCFACVRAGTSNGTPRIDAEVHVS